MNLSRPFILRPVATALLMVAILLAGLLGLQFLPVSALPQVDYPTIQVRTFYPGASPEIMTSGITAPLEGQLGQMPGLMTMSSASAAGVSIITLQFSLSLSLDIAEQEVQAAINAAANLLPSDLPAPPIYAKINPADAPILTLAVSSKTLPLIKVEDLVDNRIAQKISQLPGVGLVSIRGGQRPAVRIRANLRALAAYGLNLDDLRSTIANANVNTPKGTLDGPSTAYAISANDQLQSAAEFTNLVIAYRNGNPVRLADVATAIEGAENTSLSAWSDLSPAIVLNIQRQPGANVVKVADTILALLPSLQAALPAGVDLAILTDRTTAIRASVNDVEFELILSLGLVVLVIFVFLRSIPATVIPSLSMPLSIIGSFGVMYLLGYSLNNLSLMALTIATGFVVDDAIVMIENIARYVEAGETPLEAALKGARQIGFTILSLTLSLIAVLIPLLFMSDLIGRLFREFAMTLVVTILISAVVSLTLVPMLCAKLLRPHHGSPKTGTPASWFDRLIAAYGHALTLVLRHRFITLSVAAATLGLTLVLYITIPKGFFPTQDTALIQAVSEAPRSISYDAMTRRQMNLVEAILQDKDVRGVSSFIGVDGANMTLNTGRLLISLKPMEERSATIDDVIRRLSGETAHLAGLALYMQPVQDLTIDTAASRTQYQFVMQDADPGELDIWANRLVERLERLPQLTDITSNAGNKSPALYIKINRDSAARFGITPATLDNVLYDAFGQRIISTIFTQENQYRVILEADPHALDDTDALSAIYLPSADGGQVPLAAIASLSEKPAPIEIDHIAQFPSVTISFNLAPQFSLGEAVAAIRKAQADLAMPVSVITNFQGAALAFQASLSNQLLLILAAIVTMYIVLGVLYESFIHPITILSTLPSATVGALLALAVTRSDLGIMAIIGIILLIGIVKKNAIMMIDFALAVEREEGKPPQEAIHQACLLRFRPILMTTMAALLGALPLIIGGAPGSELRQPLGITIIGGLILSQILTLFTTPVIYLAFSALSRRFARSGFAAALTEPSDINDESPA